jgi:hypothetical protein
MVNENNHRSEKFKVKVELIMCKSVGLAKKGYAQKGCVGP